jgi:hypothetical protein
VKFACNVEPDAWMSRAVISYQLIFQQDKQGAYNVTLKRVHATIVAVERQYVLTI